jgi:hypothetical protein
LEEIVKSCSKGMPVALYMEVSKTSTQRVTKDGSSVAAFSGRNK